MQSWQNRKADETKSKSKIKSKPTSALREIHKLIENLLEYRRLKKLHVTYIKGVKDAVEYNKENKVYCEFNLDTTVTGRVSCRGYKAGKYKRGVSYHTLPRQTEHNIRELFIAPPGWVVVTSDYSQMELRVLAQISKEKTMQQAFIDRKDLHNYSACLAFEKSSEKVTDADRQLAKSISFLVIFGGTAATLSLKYGIPIKIAEKAIESWYKAFPGVPQYMEYIRNFIYQHGYSYTLFGRRRHLQNIYSKNRSIANRAFRQGLNFTVQSPASDVLLCAMLGAFREFKEKSLKARIPSQVHDSLISMCPIEELEEVYSIITRNCLDNPVMVNELGVKLDFPLEIDTKIGKAFSSGLEYKSREELDLDKIKKHLND